MKDQSKQNARLTGIARDSDRVYKECDKSIQNPQNFPEDFSRHNRISMSQFELDSDLEKTSEKAVRDWESFVAIYDGLREAARRRMHGVREEISLGATGLVHEVFLRLRKDQNFDPKCDESFMFASSLRAMREILIDRARSRQRIKRGGGMHQVLLDESIAYFEEFDFDVQEIHKALVRLEELDHRQGSIVTMRYFLRMTNAEVAVLLHVSVSLIETELRLARAWLRRELKELDPRT